MESSSVCVTYSALVCCMLTLLFPPGQVSGSTLRIHVYVDASNALDVSISTNLSTSLTSGCLEKCSSNYERVTVSGQKYCRSGGWWCALWDYTATVQNSEFKIDIQRFDLGREVRLNIMCLNTPASLFMCGDKQTGWEATRTTRGERTYDVECAQDTTTSEPTQQPDSTLTNSTHKATLSMNSSFVKTITTGTNSTTTPVVLNALSTNEIIGTTVSSGVQPEDFLNQRKPVSSLAIVLPIVILVILILVTLSIIYIRRRRHLRKGDSSQPPSPGGDNNLEDYDFVTNHNPTTSLKGQPQEGDGDNVSYHLMEIRPRPAEPEMYAQVIQHTNHAPRTPLYEDSVPSLELVDNDLYESSHRD